MSMLAKYKQGEMWMEGTGGVQCPEICRNDKYQTADGHLTPDKNQFIALNRTTERIVVTYILMKPEHVAAYQHVLLTKKSFPVPAFAYPVRKRIARKDQIPTKRMWT